MFFPNGALQRQGGAAAQRAAGLAEKQQLTTGARAQNGGARRWNVWAAVGSGGHMATTLQSNAVTVLLQPQVTNPVNVCLSVPTILYEQQDFLVILSEICTDQKNCKGVLYTPDNVVDPKPAGRHPIVGKSDLFPKLKS